MTTTMDLSREIEVAKILREQIADLAQGDEDFIRDTIEGETNVREIIAALVANEAEDLALLEGIDALSKRLSGRKERIETRIQTRRALMASGMSIAEIKKLETPGGTIFTKAVPPKAEVVEEADIPPKFFVVPPPKLDRKALLAAMKDGEAVPGARLTNGGMTIQIRS